MSHPLSLRHTTVLSDWIHASRPKVNVRVLNCLFGAMADHGVHLDGAILKVQQRQRSHQIPAWIPSRPEGAPVKHILV